GFCNRCRETAGKTQIPSSRLQRMTKSLVPSVNPRPRARPIGAGRFLMPPPKVRGNGPRLCAEHQPQRHGEATRSGIIRRLLASVLAAAGPSDTAAPRWWFQVAAIGAWALELA